uniref:Uncharacterized protein n=1 Tax=Arundo donax TaxID=35708 RepID=A0A0A9FLE4_ARUDO
MTGYCTRSSSRVRRVGEDHWSCSGDDDSFRVDPAPLGLVVILEC